MGSATLWRVDVTVPPPNLFDFATSELSQAAFICWLAKWADPAFREIDGPLHAAAVGFVSSLLEIGKGPPVPTIRTLEVHPQSEKIDVLLVLNGDTAIIIEDKTDTADHSDQLRRYRDAVVAAGFPPERIAAVYLKTGDQSSYQSANDAGYGQFLRPHFLAVLEHGERLGVTNAIFTDFLAHLRSIEEAVQSFQTTPLRKWDAPQWRGFFMALQKRLGYGDWNYVANPSGGFMGFWWHGQGDKYLQLENDKLCYKIAVPDEAQRAAKWWEWHNALAAEGSACGVAVKKPVRRPGRWMTVAVHDGDYRQVDAEGRLDLDRTVDVLRRAEALMNAALLRVPDGSQTTDGTGAPEGG
jgi:hypothetical protein